MGGGKAAWQMEEVRIVSSEEDKSPGARRRCSSEEECVNLQNVRPLLKASTGG